MDSIVRVEAHRLRKRLREYYAGEGAGHSIKIDVPPGQYTPRFVCAADSAETPEIAQTEPPLLQPVEQEYARKTSGLTFAPSVLPTRLEPLPQKRRGRNWLRWLAAAVVVMAAVGLLYLRRPQTRSAATAADAAAAIPSGEEVRILCGVESGSYVDAQERVWQSDAWYQGGVVAQVPHNQIVIGTRDPSRYTAAAAREPSDTTFR